MAQAGPSSSPESGYKCGCKCCQHILNDVKCTATGKTYKITQSLNCMTPDVIYIIHCQKCQWQYIGRTSTKLQRRFENHRASIIDCQDRPVANHFKKKGHSLDDLKIFPIEQVDGAKALSDRELYWIREFGISSGGNERPTEGQVEKSMESDTLPATQEGKRKCHWNEDPNPKKSKMETNGQTEYHKETEDLLLTCEDALGDAKEAMSNLEKKLSDWSVEEQAEEFLKRRSISDLKEYKQKEIFIGLFGRTGSGKSSLINAVVKEDCLLPSGSSGAACTSCFVQVQASAEPKKYSALIEFISEEDWKSELEYLVDLCKNKKDQQNMTEEDQQLVEMAQEKLQALYQNDGLEKDATELAERRVFPSNLTPSEDNNLTFSAETAEELSERIEPYIRSDKKSPQLFWPLVKRVSISLPKSSPLPEGIILVDLPGAGDISKHRSEMWKQYLSQCSSVWIVTEISRALAEGVKEEIFSETLRSLAGGGECRNITIVCTKTAELDPNEFKRNLGLTNKKLGISESADRKTVKKACILFRNKDIKDHITEKSKNKATKLLCGDEEFSDAFFDVYTVSSKEYNDPPVLEDHETELPLLREHIKKLFTSDYEKGVKNYVSEVSGFIPFILSSKPSDDSVFKPLERRLDEICNELKTLLEEARKELLEKLELGAAEAKNDCLKSAKSKVLQPKGTKRAHYHMTIRALCRNNGFHQTLKGQQLDLNYTLSEPMYRKIKEGNLFLRIFSDHHQATGVSHSKPTRSSIKVHFTAFQDDFIPIQDLERYKMETSQGNYWHHAYIRAEQIKLIKKLEEVVLKRKKKIYFSLSDSIKSTLKKTYKECSDFKGAGWLANAISALEKRIEESKDDMFLQAMKAMLEEFDDLKEKLLEHMKKKMTDSIDQLRQLPDDPPGLPDVDEEIETMKRCCGYLGLQIF